MPVSQKKRNYAARLVGLVEEFNNVLIVHADNVGSKQMQQIRHALRGEAEIIMGKNTTIRKVLKDYLKNNPDHPISALMPAISGNVGLVFTNSDVGRIRDVLVENRVPAPARANAVAPVDVFVEPGPTGCDPGQTAWFQALNIPTKINRGQIEMISRVQVVKEGEKVPESSAALLQRLNINPFSYGLVPLTVYENGEVFDARALDIKPEDLLEKLQTAISTMAAIGLKLGYPTKASVPHSLNNAFKTLISIHLGTNYKFERAQPFEDFLKNPANFVAAPAAGGAAAAAEEEEDEEEEEEDVAGGNLFGGDSSSDDDSD